MPSRYCVAPKRTRVAPRGMPLNSLSPLCFLFSHRGAVTPSRKLLGRRDSTRLAGSYGPHEREWPRISEAHQPCPSNRRNVDGHHRARGRLIAPEHPTGSIDEQYPMPWHESSDEHRHRQTGVDGTHHVGHRIPTSPNQAPPVTKLVCAQRARHCQRRGTQSSWPYPVHIGVDPGLFGVEPQPTSSGLQPRAVIDIQQRAGDDRDRRAAGDTVSLPQPQCRDFHPCQVSGVDETRHNKPTPGAWLMPTSSVFGR